MNQKSVRITSALTALSALAAAVVAVVAVSSSGILSAQSATTTIDLLNVGMCVTTDDSVFKESDCDDGDGGNTFTVGDRDEIVERETVYATYAHDPISSSEQPRAILTNTDLVKVTISDKGRDRRRTVIYPVAGLHEVLVDSVPGNDAAQALLLARIKELLGESVDDEQDITDFNGKDNGVRVYRNDKPINDPSTGGPGNALVGVSQSGNFTLSFTRTGTDDFLPLSSDEVNDVVKWFGYLIDVTTPGNTEASDIVSVDKSYVLLNTDSNTGALDNQLLDLGAESDPSLIADEDRSEGGENIAPWMQIQANIPNGKRLVVIAVAYETSDAEVIEGDEICSVPLTVTPMTGTPTTNAEKCAPNSQQGDTEPNYTSSEINGRAKLVARVQGDNGQDAQNLYLKETGKFTGKYEGYVRLTDANGIGAANSRDWGRAFVDGTAATADGATVIGVQNGPATITYKDSNGATRTMSIEVDIQPPTITIASPLHNSSGDDRSPDFVGTFEDGGAGLADDTFKLYVDNVTDGGEGSVGDSLSDTIPVLDIASGITLRSGKTVAELRRDYAAQGASSDPFGILDGRAADDGPIYFTMNDPAGDQGPQASETNNDAERKIVNADIYEDGDGQGTFDDDARVEGSATNGREVAVDFQGVVIDLAGNIGFSDADTAAPSFINDFGTAVADRKSIRFHNVLGFYSRHVINLDDKDPEFQQANTITGFYGLDSDDDPVPHRRGIMITFDNDISQDNITENTFDVELDDGTKAVVDAYRVEDNLVFLRLTADLKTSETPKISIASGQRVEDFAGNQLQAREVDAFEAKDGVPPTLTLSLSNGSGTGEGNESSASLTRNTIVVSVESDEELQGAPLVSVVCSNFNYADPGTTTPRKDVDDFANARSGRLESTPSTTGYVTPRCGTGSTAQSLTPTQTQMYSRPGLNWEYTWRNLGGSNAVPEGELRVVVFARDKSQYKITAAQTAPNNYNWGSADTKFTYDTSLKPLIKGSSIDSTAGTVLPTPNQKVSESRPFIMLHFSGENTEVTIEQLQVDDVDVTSRVESNERNRFIYWPEGLNFGMHTVEVDARDAAGNEATFQYEFEVVTRAPFVVRLLAGWNAVSLPQQPVDGSLESAFSNPAIDQVISYVRANNADAPQWLLATRQDGIWTTNYGDLTDITAGLGYWVHTDSFVNQSIPLRSPERLSQDLPSAPVGITTFEGWNFVGVVDQDGDQTQNDWGQSLKLGDVVQTGRMYLGSYVRAYTWDSTRSQFEALEPADDVEIGRGIWVYYGEGVAP